MPRIHVGIRAKPHNEVPLSDFTVKSTSCGKEPAVKVEISVSSSKTEFIFDQYFSDTCSQSELFESCGRPVVDEVLEGFNGSVFAYGQTGAGKTYTVSGPTLSGGHDNRGLCSRTIDYLFNASRSVRDGMISIKFSAIEIYNDVATDLLRPASEKDSPRLTIMDSPGGILIPDLLLFPLSSSAEGHHKLYEANTNRSVAEHQLNRQSSRSHAIYTYHITRAKISSGKSSDEADDAVMSKLNLVDLAGSERIEKSGSTGGLAKEAAHINRSLTFLEQVVVALTQSKRDHIPYRQSKLTYLLKDSLGGNCNTYLIACIWTSSLHGWETLSTLRFASRMKCIENTPIRNKLVQKDSSSSTRHLLNQIDALKKELAMRDIICGKVEPWLAELSRHQTLRSSKAMIKYISSPPDSDVSSHNSVEHPELHSLAEARFMLNFAKKLLWEACDRNESRVLALTERINQKVSLPEADEVPVRSGSGGSEQVAEVSALDIEKSGSDKIIDGTNNLPASDTAKVTTAASDAILSPLVSFDDFKVTAGAEIQLKYDTAKNNLKIVKARQKQLVNLINKQKAEIDRCNEIIQIFNQEKELGRAQGQMPDLNVSNEHNVTSVERDNNLELIEIAKKIYREAHADLILCKKEIEDLQLVKKRCLAELLSSYETYCRQQS